MSRKPPAKLAAQIARRLARPYVSKGKRRDG